MPTTETVLNAALAEVLREQNVLWRESNRLTAEQTGVITGGGRPDIVVHNDFGAPVIIETEFAPARSVESDAVSRLGQTHTRSGKVIESCIAVRIPQQLRDQPQERLPAGVRDSTFEYCLFSGTAIDEQEPVRWPSTGFLTGSISDLASLIENTSVSNRLVEESLTVLQDGVDTAASILSDAAMHRHDIGKRIHELLHQQQQAPGIHEQTARMAMAIVANALTFHCTIAELHDIAMLSSLRHEDDPETMSQQLVLTEWRRILRDINYWPIFNIAQQILALLPSQTGSRVLTILASTATILAEKGVTRSHDLAGRMFQRLICDRKFLATYYTLPSSSALLAELAVEMLLDSPTTKQQLCDLRIADLACGTGTLLAAAYHAILQRYRRTGNDDSELHPTMMEQTLIAADIMPAATHLTTSMLSSAHPAKVFERTCVYTLPYGKTDGAGGDRISIGSLDLIADEFGVDLFGSEIRAARGTTDDRDLTAREVLEEFSLTHGSLDLVIINPPFTSPTNHSVANAPIPSFAGFNTSKDEQTAMSNRLERIYKNLQQPAGHGNAGLATNFLDLAHVKLKSGGVLAMVVPLAIVQGKAWEKSRKLLARSYEDIHFVTIATSRARDKAFSADTGMGEALVLARKRDKPQSLPASVRYINLHARPSGVVEAVETARAVTHLSGREKVNAIQLGADVAGIEIAVHAMDGGYAAVRDYDVARTAFALIEGQILLPRMDAIDAPLDTLSTIGQRGLLHRDINGEDRPGVPRGPFDHEPITGTPTYPALWGHDANRERCLIVEPDRQCITRPGMDSLAQTVWAMASHLHFTLEFGTASQSLTACYTTTKCIGGRAWPSFHPHDPKHDKLLALWANSTLGMVGFWFLGTKQHPGRACLTITRLPEVPSIAPEQLSPAQLQRADTLFDRMADQSLLPARKACIDPNRYEIDRGLLIDVLGLPEVCLDSLSLLREKWCAEPTVHGGRPVVAVN